MKKNKILIKHELMISWLYEIKWKNLSIWEKSFIKSAMNIDSVSQKQIIKIEEIYKNIRFPEKKNHYKFLYRDVDLGDYDYIHDFS